ncbi:hypothetical protein HMPREF9089_01089 [Eubacterium brachy ATCC 33089]|nr:hypothetical protein HMPREF9089_01089 [Eubacterium brachy ATCC 33089]
MNEVDNWQKRSLDLVYPIMFIDTAHFSVREIDRFVNQL